MNLKFAACVPALAAGAIWLPTVARAQDAPETPAGSEAIESEDIVSS